MGGLILGILGAYGLLIFVAWLAGICFQLGI
jgi:hypothetical protein